MIENRAPVDQDKLMQFIGKAVGEWGGALSVPLVLIGDRLGLYKAMADGEPFTASTLAAKTGTEERYIQEWLSAQAAGGFVTYDPANKTFSLPPEQAAALSDEQSPACILGMYQIVEACVKDTPKIAAAFQNGEGVGWHEHDEGLFEGTRRFFEPGYRANLITSWIPALDGVEAKLQRGARVADVGCGLGSSTILMAQAYPKSTFVGYDYHEGSIARARTLAKDAGVADRVTFETVSAATFPGKNFDLVAYFDCVHDMGDPVGAIRHTLSTLAPGGTILMVEPFANDNLEDNLNPVGRVFYSASTLVCTPASRSQEVGLALGAQSGEARMRAVFQEAGARQFRRATETPFNIIYEAKA